MSKELQKIRQNLLAIRSGATPAEMSERMREMCNINGYDPVYELMDLIRNGAKVTTKDSEGNLITAQVPIDVKEQLDIHKTMIKYIYPQVKSVEIKGTMDHEVHIHVKEYNQPFRGKETAIDAEFTTLQEQIEKNVATVIGEAN